MEVPLVENGDSIKSLTALIDPADGVMDDVPALRLQYGADLVQLVTLDGDISPATMTVRIYYT
jgi:hypothetical protein